MNPKMFKSKQNKNHTNFILTAFILLISIVLIVVQNESNKQDELLMNDFKIYEEANSLLKEGNTENLVSVFEKLHNEYSYDDSITYRLGYSYLNNGDYSAALTMYTKTLDLNPYLVENNNYMYQYAVVLANNSQYDNAILVIDRLFTLPMDETFKSTVIELKDNINKMKGSTT